MGKIKFNPQKYRPIPNGGHPDLNPDSVAYQEYWAKETDRCMNGFKPKGMKKISGKYYFNTFNKAEKYYDQILQEEI